MKFLIIKVGRNNEFTYEKGHALFTSLSYAKSVSTLDSLRNLLFGKKDDTIVYSFNIISIKQKIYFVIGVPEDQLTHLTNQVLAQYTNADIEELGDLSKFGITQDTIKEYTRLKLSGSEYLPFKNISEFVDVDPMASILSAISRAKDPSAFFWLQMLITPTSSAWQKKALAYAGKLKATTDLTKPSETDQQKATLIQEKIKYNGFKTQIRLATDSVLNMGILKDSFNVYAKPNGNTLHTSDLDMFKQKKLGESIYNFTPLGSWTILNTLELASLWHMPAGNINIPNIAWGRKIVLDPPENLPIAEDYPNDEDKLNLTFFGKTKFKNQDHIFGVKKLDRLRHIYIVGKTGTGKSTFIENLAVEDIRKGAGVAVLDPHGETIDHILQYIPKRRLNDVCYFNPSDPDYAYPLNMLEVTNEQQRELLVSGIVAIFYKLYGTSWGPRLEYILRNAISTLVLVEGATLIDVVRLLSETKYRNKIIKKIDDQVLIRFWEKEFNVLDDRQRNEQIASILNKVGQFVTSPLVRKIIQWPKSKVKISEIMDNNKILLCDLSQGKIGEDNATLLGSMLITQIQIAALNRAFKREDERVPFYLYVDEFQNFATTSFSKILSEARKYKLGLTLGNQYISQIEEDIMAAILGNVGTLTTFNVSAGDADILSKEFGPQVSPDDLTNLEKYQMVTRLAIDGRSSEAFTCNSLPPPKNISGHLDQIITNSRRTYGTRMDKKDRFPDSVIDDSNENEKSDKDKDVLT